MPPKNKIDYNLDFSTSDINYTDMDFSTQLTIVTKIYNRLRNHKDVILYDTTDKINNCKTCKFSVSYGFFKGIECKHILHLNERVDKTQCCNLYVEK